MIFGKNENFLAKIWILNFTEKHFLTDVFWRPVNSLLISREMKVKLLQMMKKMKKRIGKFFAHKKNIDFGVLRFRIRSQSYKRNRVL